MCYSKHDIIGLLMIFLIHNISETESVFLSDVKVPT